MERPARSMLITNIKSLLLAETRPRRWVAGTDMAEVPVLDHAWLHISGERIEAFGSMDEREKLEKINAISGNRVVDASDRMVMPAFCDPHTHLVYAGSREGEFADRIRGLSYQEIARMGGGILSSTRRLHEASEGELFEQSMQRVGEIMQQGTGAVEIKSGYGLNLKDELKMLRVIRKIGLDSPLTVRSTFLGAHAIPPEYKKEPDRYVNLVVNEMIPAVAAENLADFIDVFCDAGFFTPGQTNRIIETGWKYGLRPKIHANELERSGGIQAGVAGRALSVDHLEHTGDEEVGALSGSETMPTLLPGASFFLGLSPPPARKIIDSGLPLALASDYNPGSSPSGNMKLMMSLACVNLKMLPAEALNAATLNAAYAMGLEKSHGSICPGKTANFIITKKIPSWEFLPYAYGSDLIHQVVIEGTVQ